jgi:hypothetical protein
MTPEEEDKQWFKRFQEFKQVFQLGAQGAWCSSTRQIRSSSDQRPGYPADLLGILAR